VDDDDVAELADLRRRAYGPDADIHEDPSAVARLDELETRTRRRFAAGNEPGESEAATTPGDSAREPKPVASSAPADSPMAEPAVTEGASPASVTESAGGSAAVVIEPDGAAPARPPRRGRRIALVTGAAAVAVLAVVQATGVATAPEPEETLPAASDVRPAAAAVSDSSETTLVDIPLDRSLARYVPQTPQPQFPVEGGLSWAESLGPYYGWTLWLARTTDREQRCILLERDDKVYAQCLADEGFLAGELEVAIPFGDIAADYRPARMTGGQSIVYRWTPERGVAIVLDQADITYFGDDD
jgi:hypothetical protein